MGGAQLAQAPDQLQVQAVAPQSSDAAPAALNPALPVLPLTPPVFTAALPCEPQAGSPISGSSPRSSPPPISIPSSSAFATPKSARSSGTGSWSVVSPALRSLFRPQSKYGPPLPRPAHLQARTPRRGPYPAPVPGCTPLPLPRYHRSPPAGVGFSAPLPAPVLRPASLYAIYPSNRLACPKALQASGSELNLADLSAAHGANAQPNFDQAPCFAQSCPQRLWLHPTFGPGSSPTFGRPCFSPTRCGTPRDVAHPSLGFHSFALAFPLRVHRPSQPSRAGTGHFSQSQGPYFEVIAGEL